MADDSANAYLTRVLVVSQCIFAMAFVTTVARALTRLFVVRQFGLDDYLVVTATILIDAIRAWFAVSTSRPDLKCGKFCTAHYIVSILYIFQIALIKLSLLAFYHRILPVTSPYRYTLYLIAGVVGAFSIATGLVRDPPLQLIAGLLTVRQASIFQCRRVPEAFGLHFPDSGARSSCEVDPFILQASIGVFNLATDLVLLALPIRIVYQLQISKKKRFGPALVFLVGVVGTVATAVRIGAIVKIERQGIAMATLSRWALTMSDIVWLSFVEINLAIMCANFPALAGLWNVMRRRYRSWRALSHRSDGRQQSCDVERSTRRPGWSLTTSDIPQKKRAKARSVSQEQLDLELAASNLSESNPAPTMSISEDDDDDDDDDDDEDEDLAGRFGPRVTKPNA